MTGAVEFPGFKYCNGFFAGGLGFTTETVDAVSDLTSLSAADDSFIMARNSSPNNFLSIGESSKAALAATESIGAIRDRLDIDI